MKVMKTPMSNVVVDSPNVKYTEDTIEAVYEYSKVVVEKDNDRYVVSTYLHPFR